MRPIVMIMTLLIAALGWQSWRLNNASHTIETQDKELNSKKQALTQKNSQLIALNILTQTSSQAQTQLYAAAETNNTLLRDRQRRIEELKRENEELRIWANSRLPDAVVRLRKRPAIAGGESYREWLSQNHPVPPGAVNTKK
ncbi:LysB family phage lysis regulatory protein [Erwinia billingiae]|uniref:Rz-like lysis system protein LysB n=1 Tax=Erwinia billingiae TaxID=182337 RepID=UPI0012485251|nr:Rz-like lysis system protein LysB [Erwinia billingiae]QEW34438.1 LysB family phage lysis regulatory protein [Erwinia billingiae]